MPRRSIVSHQRVMRLSIHPCSLSPQAQIVCCMCGMQVAIHTHSCLYRTRAARAGARTTPAPTSSIAYLLELSLLWRSLCYSAAGALQRKEQDRRTDRFEVWARSLTILAYGEGSLPGALGELRMVMNLKETSFGWPCSVSGPSLTLWR